MTSWKLELSAESSSVFYALLFVTLSRRDCCDGRQEQAAAIRSEGRRLYKGGEGFQGWLQCGLKYRFGLWPACRDSEAASASVCFSSLERIRKTNILFFAKRHGAYPRPKRLARWPFHLCWNRWAHGAVRKSDTAVDHTGMEFAINGARSTMLNRPAEHHVSSITIPDFPIYYRTELVPSADRQADCKCVY